METAQTTPESPLTDQEIDALIRQVVLTESPDPQDRSPDRGQLSALWYLAVFLLGMTVTEGLRVMIPPLQEVRGEAHYRCGEREAPNPADAAPVAWTPE